MESFPLVIILPIATFALIVLGAMWSRRKTKERQYDNSVPKSSLAVDAPSDRRAP